MVDIPTTDTVSGEIPNGNLMLVLDPASDTPKTQSYSDLKANIRAGLTGGGGSGDTSALSAIVNHLSEVTADLALHEQTHVWARTTQSTSTEGYYWDTSGQNTQASARSNGIWANHQTNFPANAEIYFLVVIPGGSNASTPKPDDYRVLLNSSEGTAYPLLVSHMRSIGENAAGTLSYFTATEPVDTGELTSVELQKQTLTSTGSTKYSGELDRSTAYAAIKEIIVGGTDNDTDETVTLSAGSGGGGSRPTITRVNPTTSQDNTTNGRLAGTVWASDTPARAAVSAISSTADGDMAIYRVFAFTTTDAVVVFLRQGASWFQIANVEVSSSRTSGAVFSEERPLEPGQATLVVPGNGIPGREANDATFLDLTTGLVSERIRLIDFSAVHDSDLEPGYIERAQGHDFPDTVNVQWKSGEVPPVTILSPLTFVKPVVPGMIIGLEIVATGGGGGIAPVLTMDLRNSDGEVISTAITVERTGELGYHQLEVTDRTVGPVTLALEGVDGSDSGAFTIEIVDVLAFTGTGSAARLIAQVADRIINLGEGAPEMGITSDEAIALINQLVPAAQRLPPLAGHGSALAQVAPDASAVHLVQPTTIADSVTATWAQPGQERPGSRLKEGVLGAGTVGRIGDYSLGLMSTNADDVVRSSISGFIDAGRFKGTLRISKSIAGVDLPSDYYYRVNGDAIVPTTNGIDTASSDLFDYLGEGRRLFQSSIVTHTQVGHSSRRHQVTYPIGHASDFDRVRGGEFLTVHLPDATWGISGDEFTGRVYLGVNQGASASAFAGHSGARFERVAAGGDWWKITLTGPGADRELRVRDLIAHAQHRYNLAAGGRTNEVAVNGELTMSVVYLALSEQDISILIDVPLS